MQSVKCIVSILGEALITGPEMARAGYIRLGDSIDSELGLHAQQIARCLVIIEHVFC